MDYVNNAYYDEYGSRTSIAYANGVVSQYSYDVLMHRLVQLKTYRGDSTYQNITYSYDKVGNIVTRTENGIVMSDNTVKNITHRYEYDTLYRLTQAEGTIKENGTTVNSYTNTLQYSSIGTIMSKIQTVTIAGENDPNLTYTYNYSYAPNKPHAVAGINDNLTYRYDANGNMTAMYDTAKQFNRILYWDDDNRLTKTVDTTSGASVPTQYHYDAKGMRIVKDGPYGKSIYIDTGYVESGAPQTPTTIVSNHIFVGNTRVASVVKHTEEKNPATYYYASDHLGSSSVLTTQQGSYHERIEYLPYGEVWVEDKATSDGYTTPYKFTGKELDTETGLYYFGARYYDAKISRWISTDPAFALYLSGKPNGGIYNPINVDVYRYGMDNPIKYLDPDGNADQEGWEIFKYVNRLPGGENPGKYKRNNDKKDTPIANTNAESVEQAKAKVEDTKDGVETVQQNGNQQRASNVLEVVPAGAGRITSPYGKRKHPITGKEHMHTGTDVAAPEGTSILSLTQGKVENVEQRKGYGWQVSVQSENGDIVSYSHIQKGSIEVKVGDAVNVGDNIAGVGDTGMATGYHVHIEVTLPGGRKENPEEYFK